MPRISDEKLAELESKSEKLTTFESRLSEAAIKAEKATVRAEEASADAGYMQEALADAVRSQLAQEDVGWRLIGGRGDEGDGFTLDQLHEVSAKLREWADTNPLLKRGLDVRCSYLYSNGYKISTSGNGGTVSARLQAVIDDPINQQNVFSMEALASAEKDRYTNGQHYAIYDKARKRFTVIPFAEITDAISNPDDTSDVWYYKHEYSRKILNFDTGQVEDKLIEQWYVTDTYAGESPKTRSINGKSIVPNKVIVDHRVNRSSGDTFGTPDAFAASPWAIAYSSYLRDGIKLHAALAEWAWQVSPKSKSGADRAGAQIRSRNGEAGRTAISDMEMKPLPKAGSVDVNEGRPYAAQVASALGISVVLLLSDPGQSGAYGTAQTLEDPTLKSMLFRLVSVREFLKRCLTLVGVKDVEVEFGRMARDAAYREGQTLQGAWGTGLFHADEIRPLLAETAGITLTHGSAPEGAMVPNNEFSLNRKDIDTDGTASTQNPDGSNSQENGQGRANTSQGNVSAGNNDLRDSSGSAAIN